MDLLTLALFAVVLLFTYSYWKFKDHPHGPYGLPLVGYALFLGKRPHETFKKLSMKQGDIYCLNLGNEPVVVVNNWETIKDVLINKGTTFSGRPPMFGMDFLFDGKDIVTNDGPTFRKQKQLSMQILRHFGMGKSSMESIVMDEVEKLTLQLKLLKGKPVEVTSLFFSPTINVIWGITAGKNLDSTDINTARLRKAIIDLPKLVGKVGLLSCLPALRHIMPDTVGFTDLKIVKETISKYLDYEVDEHRRNFDENSIKDFIDNYLAEMNNCELKNAPHLAQDHLIATIFDLLIAGTETVSSTMSWAMLYMCLHPEIQQKIQTELDSVIGENSYLPFASKEMVPYTQATILEVERISSVVPLSVPHRSIKDTIVKGCRIPKGTSVLPNLWGMHNDINYWGDPQNFRPERFLDDNGTVVKHECLLPFSAGPRLCPAKSMGEHEMHIIFTCLLHRFSFQLIPGQEKPSTDPVVGMTATPKEFSAIVVPRLGR